LRKKVKIDVSLKSTKLMKDFSRKKVIHEGKSSFRRKELLCF